MICIVHRQNIRLHRREDYGHRIELMDGDRRPLHFERWGYMPILTDLDQTTLSSEDDGTNIGAQLL
jgi:hypothetical protein